MILPCFNPLLLLAGFLAPCVQDGAESTFEDPAPPEVRPLDVRENPPALSYEGLTTHAAPRSLAKGAISEDWPGFLGPRRDGTSLETELLEQWPDGGPTLLWEMERGEGFASPIVVDGRVIFPHRVGSQSHIDCLDLETGRRYWRHTSPCAYKGRYIADGGPRATPVAADGIVYVHGVDGRFFALDLETGSVVWQRNFAEEFEVPDNFFGVVTSPLILEDRLILNLGAPEGPTVAAFDRRTGRLLWGAGTEWGASCASPVVARMRGRDRLLVITGGQSRPPVGGLLVLDPETGAVEHRYPFRSRTYESVNGASPVAVGNGVLLTASYGLGSAFLELDGSGEFQESWRERRFGLQFSTPLNASGVVYAVDGVSGRAGAIVRLDHQTGKVEWREDVDERMVFPEGNSERPVDMSVGEGSLMGIGERLLCLGDTGLLLLLEPGDDGARILTRAGLFFAPDTWTPPVLSHGILLVCQNKPDRLSGRSPRLLAYDLRAGD